jgi:farnesyl-diphosphate farnesyltransferase
LRWDHLHPAFNDAMRELIAVAHGSVRDAIRYTLLIPRQEVGIRRFPAWAIGLALLTLRKIQRHPDFRSGGQVEVSRRTVGAIVATKNTVIGSNSGFMALYRMAARGLPRPPDRPIGAFRPRQASPTKV